MQNAFSRLSQALESSISTSDPSPVEGSTLIFSTSRGNTFRGHSCMSFVVVVYLLETEFLTVTRIILESVLIAIEPITLLTNVGSCMANIPGLLELVIYLTLLDHLMHMTLILLIFLLMNL